MNAIRFLHPGLVELKRNYYHYNEVPRMTVAYIKTGKLNDSIAYSFAVCAKTDHFSRKKGRELAAERLNTVRLFRCFTEKGETDAAAIRIHLAGILAEPQPFVPQWVHKVAIVIVAPHTIRDYLVWGGVEDDDEEVK